MAHMDEHNTVIDEDDAVLDKDYSVATKSQETAIDESLGLKSISIRLQTSLIEDLKMIAMANGIGYQPLIRTLLTRFAQSELRRMAMDQAERMAAVAQEHLGDPKLEMPDIDTVLPKKVA